MKKSFLTFTIVLFSVCAYSQPTNDEVNYIQSIWGMEKREIVKKYMKLSENESTDFWAVYEKYEESRKELGRERINAITDYVQNVAVLTDAKAEELILKMISNQTRFLELLNSSYYQMKAVISQLKAMQFIQLENYLDTALKLKIMDELPMAGEIKK